MKKKVIAYVHTHWDREWYREFEVFRLRLLRVFDNVLQMLDENKIPSFYFDGQVSALLDYLEIRPEKETIIRKFIKEKKLFIGPCYTLVDEFLTDKTVFEKNLEIGMKIAKDFGCDDFIGYLADTFGHSKNIPPLLLKHGIDKCMVWRGCGEIPAEFRFNGIDTVNLIRGYFMDIFSAPMTIEQKAEWLKDNLDKIAEKSSDVLLLPIGADHLGVKSDIAEQISQVNKLLKNYEITLGSPFDYFKKVFDRKNSKILKQVQNDRIFEWNDELRDNSKTFILPGSYSARTKIKQLNCECTYKLDFADSIQKHYGGNYDNVIEYAYKLLLKNQAHDGICGCSTDAVHRENITRYEKILQIAETIIEELRLKYNFNTPIMQSVTEIKGYEIIDKKQGFANEILYNAQRIPITEDFTEIFTLRKKPSSITDINLYIENGKLFADDIQIEFVRRDDLGDTYNFAPREDDYGKTADIISLQGDTIKTNFFDVKFYKSENLINFKIEWNNEFENKLWQVRFNLKEPVSTTYSEDLNTIITRKFNPDYDMRKNLPKIRGIETKSNFAPMQRYVGAQGFGIITKGLTEYEVFKNTLSITILRSIGIISNPKNPARSTPAGPPLPVPEAQQKGHNCAEFSIGFFDENAALDRIKEVFPHAVFED